MQRWLWWLMPPWRPETRRRQVAEAMSELQEAERAAAVRARLAGVTRALDKHPTGLQW
jgi:hypothetical protein